MEYHTLTKQMHRSAGNESDLKRSPLKRPTVTFTNADIYLPSTPCKPFVALGEMNNVGEQEDAPLPIKQENPQDAYSSPSRALSPSPSMQTQSSSEIVTWQNHSERWRRLRKGRSIRLAAISDDVASDNDMKNFIPLTQFETTFRRRAVRKEERVQNPGLSPSRGIFGTNIRGTRKEIAKDKESMPGYDEEVGDVSLGMKLNILGGRVIVQAINPLADGRASPAQLTGMIKRGDVLIAIDGKSIVNMPLEQLVVALQPLSTPLEDGSYKRVLKLRFSAGDGLEALERNEAYMSRPTPEPGVFNITQFLPQDFPMVDQLSGLPMFEDDRKLKQFLPTPLRSPTEALKVARLEKKMLSLDELISEGIADMLRNEKLHFLSEFFSWNEDYSELLRPSLVATFRAGEEITAFLRKKKELIQQGEEAMQGAETLTVVMADIDKGKDLRSFQAWSSNASLRSRASSRRRYVLEAASVIASTIVEEGNSDVAVSVGSEELDDLEGVDGDELLLQLAAHDEVWRKQVIETILTATKDMEEADKADEDFVQGASQERDITETLGNLFLGEKVNKLLLKKKKSFALPQDEVTCVLFDLVTHLASTTPDSISVKGKFEINPQTSLLPIRWSKGSSIDRDSLLAILFVVNDVFPAWLRCFKPLPWEERRVLWPHTKASVGVNVGSVTDDMLTIDSPGASPVPIRKKKNLRETIEDMELDVESRAETCFLITFYFTQEILPSLSLVGESWRHSKSWSETDALEFVDTYGAYLKLPMAIAYAAYIKSENVVDKLLELANFDPRHQEALKEISKVNSLILYEPTMLSAIMKQILMIGQQKPDLHSHLVHLSVSAFPDLRPWLVRKGCLERINDDSDRNRNLKDLYYVYLSHLLHPADGHEAARQDSELVNEWCTLSMQAELIDGNQINAKIKNFHVVASREQPDYKMYSRDLPFLFDLAILAKDVDLMLELMNEVIELERFVKDRELSSRVTNSLRGIAADCISNFSEIGAKKVHIDRLKRSFTLYEKLCSAQQRFGTKELLSVSSEYETLLSLTNSDARSEFLALLASNATPLYALQALNIWSQKHKGNELDLIPILRMSLTTSALLESRSALTTSLFRLENARSQNSGTVMKKLTGRQDRLWRLMTSGDLLIDK